MPLAKGETWLQNGNLGLQSTFVGAETCWLAKFITQKLHLITKIKSKTKISRYMK